MVNDRNRNKFLGSLLLGSTAIMWGISYIFTKVAVRSIPPMILALLKFLGAFLVILPAAKRSRVRLIGKAHFYSAMSGLTGITFYFFFENHALKYTSASDASLIVSSAPILTMILYDVWMKRFDLFEYLGSILAFSGIFFVIYGGQFTEVSSVKGNFMAFGAAASWATYTYFFERIGSGSIRATAETILWGMLFIAPMSLYEILSADNNLLFPASAVSGVLYLGVLASAIGYYMWGKGIQLWGGKAATLWVYSIPVFTVLSDIFFFRNFPSRYFYLGALLVSGGIIISVILQFRKTGPERAVSK